MTIAGGRAEDGGEARDREAAHWFARQRSPDAEDSRAEFEAWLARGPEHLAAYNRAAEIFAMGKLLAEPHQPVVARAPVTRGVKRSMAVATIAACALGLGGWAALHRWEPVRDPSGVVAGTTDHRRISTTAGQARVVQLADGSTVRLDERTILDVDIGSTERRLKLSAGQARFEVAHEPRPFVVHAGGGTITARGTIFVVALASSGTVDVRLLQGAVDVALPRQRALPTRPIRKLAAGESASFAAQPDVPQPTVPSAAATSTNAVSSPATREFEGASVGKLVALANDGATRPIRLADAALADERVSGRFRVDDSEQLARRLGVLFGRDVDTSRPGEIVLGPPAAVSAGSRHLGPARRREAR